MSDLGRKVLPAATKIFAVPGNNFPDGRDGNRQVYESESLSGFPGECHEKLVIFAVREGVFNRASGVTGDGLRRQFIAAAGGFCQSR